MIIALFIVHMLIALALIGVVMLQKSEGGALGMGGGGMSGFMTGRSTANLLTRTTAILGAAFFATSILLVLLSQADRGPRSIIDGGIDRGGAAADGAADAESAAYSGCVRPGAGRARTGGSRAGGAERPVGALIAGALIGFAPSEARQLGFSSRAPGQGIACPGRNGGLL